MCRVIYSNIVSPIICIILNHSSIHQYWTKKNVLRSQLTHNTKLCNLYLVKMQVATQKYQIKQSIYIPRKKKIPSPKPQRIYTFLITLIALQFSFSMCKEEYHKSIYPPHAWLQHLNQQEMIQNRRIQPIAALEDLKDSTSHLLKCATYAFF